MDETNSSAMHFIAHGRVQGVGYRAATQRQAAALQLRGWVRNQPDGTVEGLAEGDQQALAALREWLHTGPRGAAVTKIDWLPTTERSGAGFVILY